MATRTKLKNVTSPVTPDTPPKVTTATVKCLTDAISCPCLEVKKCVKVSTSSTATTSGCAVDGPCLADDAKCCDNVSISVLEGASAKAEYCVHVYNTEPITRFYHGTIVVENNDPTRTITQVGLVAGTGTGTVTQLTDVSIAPGSVPVNVIVTGSFVVTNTDPLNTHVIIYFNKGLSTTFDTVVPLNADPSCDVNSWTVGDLLKDSNLNGLGVVITHVVDGKDVVVTSDYTFTRADVTPPAGIFFTVSLAEGVVLVPGSKYTNTFTITPYEFSPSSLEDQVGSNPAIVTVTSASISSTPAVTTTCGTFDDWCLCKSATLIDATTECPKLIGYTLVFTNDNPSRDCITTVTGTVKVPDGVNAPADFPYNVDLQQQDPNETTWVTIDNKNAVKAGETFTFTTSNVAAGSKLQVNITYNKYVYDMSTNITTIDNSNTVTYTSAPVTVKAVTTTAKSIFTDNISTSVGISTNNQQCNSNVIVGATTEPIYKPTCFPANPNLKITNADATMSTYGLGNLQYKEFIKGNIAEGGFDILAAYPDAARIDLVYYVVVLDCACTVTNTASVTSTHNDNITQKISSATQTTQTIPGCGPVVVPPIVETSKDIPHVSSKGGRTHHASSRIHASPQTVVQAVAVKPVAVQPQTPVLAKPTSGIRVVAKTVDPVINTDGETNKPGCAPCAQKAAAQKAAADKAARVHLKQ